MRLLLVVWNNIGFLVCSHIGKRTEGKVFKLDENLVADVILSCNIALNSCIFKDCSISYTRYLF